MKAITYQEYGAPEVLNLREVNKPVPRDNEILVKVHAASVNYGDVTARNFGNLSTKQFNMPLPLWLPSRMMFGFSKPKNPILGSEFAGEVEAVGSAVKSFKNGDAVFGYRGQKMGTHAEYLCVPEKSPIALKPENMSFEEAAVVPYGSLMALNLLKKVNIKAGDKVLINGASGGLGSAGLQLSKHHFGAEVTGVCGTASADYVKSLGADHVIDYKKEDFSRKGEKYDLIFDVLGRTPFGKSKQALKTGGTCLYASFKMNKIFKMLWTKMFDNKKMICALAIEKPEDMVFIKELIEADKLSSIIDKRFSMKQAAEAHRHFASAEKRGKVVININS